ncbi:MAG: hypothetical protein M1368_12270 [Thaumarchaeota archaeon]|nr:hypothetical protein [Nitrososphaerota archaeon]
MISPSAVAQALCAPVFRAWNTMEYILFYGRAGNYKVHRIESFDFKGAKFLANEFLLTRKRSENNGEPIDGYLCTDLGEWMRV